MKKIERLRSQCRGDSGWDDTILTMMERERQRLERLLRDIARECSTLPAGSISFKTIRGRRYFYQSTDNDTGTDKPRQRYLSNRGEKLIADLWHKRQLRETADIVAANIAVLDEFIRDYIPVSAWPISTATPWELQKSHRKRNRPVEWEREEYETNSYRPDDRIHTTQSGRKVRSKSEALIAGLLEAHGIPFRYEARLDLADRYIFPDFTIRRPRDGAIFYWEHFGLTEDPSYAEATAAKLQAYRENGLHPWNQLITTYDQANGSFDSQCIDALIRYKFL